MHVRLTALLTLVFPMVASAIDPAAIDNGDGTFH